MTKESLPILDLFDDPEHAAIYAQGPARFVPGFESLHKMAGVLIRESAPQDANVLVHGAGGGLELEAFAEQNPNWRLVGVDPAKPMLEAARVKLGPLNERVTLIHGFAEDAPEGPFDAATSFLTLHFLDAKARQKAVLELVRRLKPGAPFITVHCSFPQSPDIRATWLERHREYVVASGVDPVEAEAARKSISDDLELFDPKQDEDILRQAGLRDLTLFYSAFTWRGWIGRAP